MEKMKAFVRLQTTDMILESVFLIGGGQVDEDARLSRAILLGVYEEREGSEAMDLLMDALGM